MNLSRLEEKVLRIVAEKDLITRNELKTMLKEDSGIDMATRNLIDKQLIASLSPLGSTCYVVTQRGTRLLQE